jgi:hypothetical protein
MQKSIQIGNFSPFGIRTPKRRVSKIKDGKGRPNQACKNQQGKQSLDESPQRYGEKEKTTKEEGQKKSHKETRKILKEDVGGRSHRVRV